MSGAKHPHNHAQPQHNKSKTNKIIINQTYQRRDPNVDVLRVDVTLLSKSSVVGENVVTRFVGGFVWAEVGDFVLVSPTGDAVGEEVTTGGSDEPTTVGELVTLVGCKVGLDVAKVGL